ncbi:hypothetical protein FACS1894147_05520 [Spirochaetia bacterium]|nr:hypothetical protein FACS1894147_05520 [Spirochaetia bacterium]
MIAFFKEGPDKVLVQNDEGLFALSAGDGQWQREDVRVTLTPAEGKNNSLCVTVSAEQALTALVFCWRVDDVIPLDSLVLGDHWERGYGDLEFRGIVPDRVMPWYLLVSHGDTTMGIGVKTGARAFCSWKLSRDVLSLRVDVRNGGSGVLLGGRTLHAADIVWTTESGVSAYQAARRFCSTMCDKPVLPPHPVYGGNNWYYAYGVSSAKQILEDGKLIASLSPGGDNRPYMCIDDGWQLCRNSQYIGGPWHSGNRDFPDMPGLAQAFSKEGIRPGLWIRPLQNAASKSSLWLNPPGLRSGQGDWFLDPSLPEALEIIRQDIARIAGWGYELIKHDYSTYDLFGRWGMQMGAEITNSGWHFADQSRTSMEIVLDLYRVIAEAAGNALVIGCNTISHAAAGLFALQRTGDDTSGVEWERTRKMGVNTLAFRLCQHNTFYSADADCVGVTAKVPWELNRQWLSLLAESGTPLFVSIAPEDATAEQKRDIKAAFAIAAGTVPPPEPLDWLHSTCPSEYILNGQKRRFYWDA